jgi:maltose operon periplasmic protein
MNRIARICLAALVTVATSSCQMNIRLREAALADIANAKICCDSYRDFSFKPLALGENPVSIDASSPAFMFDTGKSFFAAYSLPPIFTPLEIAARGSYVTAGIFQPVFLILDRDRKPVQRIPNSIMKVSETSVIPRGSFRIGSDRNAEAYLVVLTTPEIVNGRTAIIDRAIQTRIIKGTY